MGTVKKIPMRKCVGCGEMKNKKEMRKMRSCWIRPAEKTEEVRIFA